MAISQKEQKLFNELHAKRQKQAEVLDDFAMRGIKQSVVDMYNQKAHFIYELLQNADDARASRVTFELYQDRLVFRHNGTERFTVSEDREDAVPYGHINAITAIGFSGKQKDEGNKIGKFGIGFKAIYQYSNTPFIYDDKFCFKIEHFVVPTQLTSDYPDRKNDETIFVFPFDNPRYAFSDIQTKLGELDNPVLFLRNLQEVDVYVKGRLNGSYSKHIYHTATTDDIEHSLVEIENHGTKSLIHLFTRKITVNNESKDNYFISVGYFINDEGKLDLKVRPNVFCFFPTSETFGEVCCICHAPFELVNSRQQLKDTSFNTQLKNMLAKLAAQALPILRDYHISQNCAGFLNGNILKMIPKKSWYSNRPDSLFREQYINILQEEPLLLTREKDYILPSEAVLTDSKSLGNLLTTEQLKQLWTPIENDDDEEDEYYYVEDEIDPSFLHPTIMSAAYKDNDINKLLVDTLEVIELSASTLLERITSNFMEKQSYEWVKRLYNFLHKNEHSTWEREATENAWKKPACSSPIVKTSDGKWLTAYNRVGGLNIFMPIAEGEKDDTYKFVSEEYLKEDITRNFLRNALRITIPDSWSFISSVIFLKCVDDQTPEADMCQYFELIYKYLNTLDEQTKQVKLREINKSFSLVTKGEYSNHNRLLSKGIYYDSPDLQIYLYGAYKSFVASDVYAKFIKKYGKENYVEFLKELGVLFYPQIIQSTSGYLPYEMRKRFILEHHTELEFKDFNLLNIENYINNENKTGETSKKLWNWLSNIDLAPYRYSSCRIKYYQWRRPQSADSSLYISLAKENWILLNDGIWHSPQDSFVEDIEKAGYNVTNNMIEFLGLHKRERDLRELGLTEEEIKRNNLGKMVEESGLSDEEVREAIEQKKAEKAARKLEKERKSSSIETEKTNHVANDTKSTSESERKSAIERKREEWEKMSNAPVGRPATSQSSTEKASSFDIPDLRHKTENDKPFFDEVPSAQKDSSKSKKDRATEKFKRKNTEAKNAAENAADANELLELFEQSPRYSFLWFKLLMDLQYAEHKRNKVREFDVSFTQYQLTNFEKGVKLSNPSKNIPDWIENAGTLEVILCKPNDAMRLASTIIRTDADSVELAIDAKDSKKFNGVVQVRLVAKDSINHIDSLRQRFIQLGFDDNYNLNDNLIQNIEFIYGPPGTGKTTRLVQKLSGILKDKREAKNILILTPTNKAADVISLKLFDDRFCSDYLTRFGATESQELIEEAVVKSRDTFYIDENERNVVVTTIARFSYDCFQPDNCAICDFNWDLIIVDEASMVDIVPMAYVLYKSPKAKFIIAGDPKQIEPVTQNDMPTYNIYDMVGLDSFKEAITNYSRFHIEALTTQHRSIPVIGQLVSDFSYDGLVKHDVARTIPKKLRVDGVNLKNLNLIGFRTEELDRLYGLTAIDNSPFHLYSAILTYNFARYVASQIEKYFPDETYSMGIITPYGAQADAISQMEEYHSISSSNCNVTVGTVHRFQGDECDIMILLLNPPANPSVNSHVNNDNIINVGMSRARDYIFFFMPQGQIDGFNIKRRLRDIIPQKAMSITKCDDLEKLMFGSPDYIERNTNVTCHMPVNVYSGSPLKYEARISDTALDIQIND